MARVDGKKKKSDVKRQLRFQTLTKRGLSPVLKRQVSVACVLAATVLWSTVFSLTGGSQADAQPNPHGQMPGASDKWLPLYDDSVPAGQVKVVVKDGSFAEGDEFKLTSSDGSVSGTQNLGKSAELTFKGLSPQKEYQVTASANGKSGESKPFTLGTKEGISVVIGGKKPSLASGMPNPRMMSGKPRAEPKDTGGQLVVRPVQGLFKMSEFAGRVSDFPVGAKIHLVAMDASAKASLVTKTVSKDNQGRVTFTDLDRSGGTAYYVNSLFSRNSHQDVLASEMISLPPEVGVRLMMAGPDKNSAEAAVDDFQKLEGQVYKLVSPGTVDVDVVFSEEFDNAEARSSEVKLIDLSTGKAIQSSKVASSGVDPSSMIVKSTRVPNDMIQSLTVGEAAFLTIRPSKNQPLVEQEVLIRKSGENDILHRLTTNPNGMAKTASLQEGVKYIAETTYRGRKVTTEEFSIKKNEQFAWAFTFDWLSDEMSSAIFNGVESGEDKVYMAKMVIGKRTFLTRPFQLSKERGQKATLLVYPDLLTRIHGGANPDDKRMFYQFQYALINPAVYPLKLSAKGVEIPLPKGVNNGSVQEEMSARVKVIPDEGFVWRGALPPGQHQFIGQFSVPIKDGASTFDLPLPYGLIDGGVNVEAFPGMAITDLSFGVHEKLTHNGTDLLQINSLRAAPGDSLKFKVTGMPTRPAWKSKVGVAVGICSLMLLGWGLFGLYRSVNHQESSADQKAKEKREQMLDKLAKVEDDFESGQLKQKIYKQKKDELLKGLKELYEKLEA